MSCSSFHLSRSFQSHLGSISTGAGGRALCHHAKFQSHLGSISTVNAEWGYAGEIEFQSHLGSISTGSDPLRTREASRFQSHLGSISTSGAAALPEKPLSRFNPTLVRLARSPSFLPHHGKGGFNPTLVRLALPELPRHASGKLLFQSHLGSISTLGNPRRESSPTPVSIPPWFD